MDAFRQFAREATRAAHDRVDGHPLMRALMRRPLTAERYRALLGLFAPIWPRLEAVYDAPAIREALPDAGVRRRAPALAADLDRLGAAADAAAARADAQPLAAPSPAYAFGWLYALEGARLGGAMIARMVADDLGLDSQDGAAFFAGGDAAAFRAALAAAAERVATAEDEIAFRAGADAAFAVIAEHCDQILASRSGSFDNADQTCNEY